ncbi:MAG: hypothetical protein V1863_01415 [Candidatus Omnitrophota bacterium]
MFAERSNYRRLKKFSRLWGAEMFGVADISSAKHDFEVSQEITKKVRRAVCCGVRLSSLVLSEIVQAPTKLYFHHYKTANMFLDQLAFAVAQWIERRGFFALPIPASQIIDWQQQKAHLSHKKIGYLAGLGWVGRNNLLVSKKFGAQFRMMTVLTDMPLATDKPLEANCGTCRACVCACPAGAIQEAPEDFKHLICFEKLKSFQQQQIVGQYVCGVCVKACFGEKYYGQKHLAH